VAYVSQRHGVSAIYAVRTDGSDQQPLVGQPPAQLFTPSASRDGAATAFVSTTTGIRNIWVSRQFTVEPFSVDGTRLDPAAGSTVSLRWGVSSSAVVSIVVVNSAGNIVRSLLARARRGPGDTETSWDGRDGQGRVVPEGAYSLQLAAQAPGLPPLQRGAGVTVDEVSLHGTLQVHTMLAGRPAPGVTLVVYKNGTGTYVTDALTDSSGAASLSLAAGTYELLAQTASGVSADVRGIVIVQRAAQQQTIILSAAVVGPNVPASPSPTPGASPSGTPTTAAPSSTATSATATPTATPVPSTSPSATAAPAITASPVPGQGTLALTVLLAPGHPAADTAINMLQGGKVVATTTSDGAGHASLLLPSGQYTVKASLDAAATTQAVTISGGATTAQTIDLQAGTLVLTIQQANGQPAAYAPIYFLSGTKAIYDTGTNGEGEAQAILPAGAYTIKAGLAPHDQTATVQIVAGATSTSTIKLR
jgi:flagellar hook assembly protein FlgD